MERNLLKAEIELLERQGCSAGDWNTVFVKEGFRPTSVWNAHFYGKVTLGAMDKECGLPGGLRRPSGIRFATLQDCKVGDNCLIENVHGYIANYDIGDDCVIMNVDRIYVEGMSTFGNGVGVRVLTETGGRDVLINDKLSAQQAYIMALYRHRPELIRRLHDIASYYTNKHASTVGEIGQNVSIFGSGLIRNVHIGPFCRIEGASRLNNGSINSNAEDPVYVGHGVCCDDFIVSSGSSLDSGASVARCFLGQSCHLGHGYTAMDSLFFSNCQGENGEACSIFAGPFTVTHHKSTLLIAGMFSFMNAGSGSNQSNHMYKLGPIHQGILDRGAKTASDSYILWPSKVGPFSLVMGRHVNHSDTSNLPFSYLIEQNNTTFLVPGVNLKSVGTIRDAQKWPRRDKRKDSNLLDCINYNLLSPYTVQKMLKGRSILLSLKKASGELSDVYSFHSAKIRNSSLNKGIQLYETAIHKFMGNSIIKRLEDLHPTCDEDIANCLRPTVQVGHGEWVDLSGLIAPKTEVDRLLDAIEDGCVNRLKTINAAFRTMHENYYTYEWTWAYDQIQGFYGIDPEKITAKDVIKIVQDWEKAVVGLDRMLYEDAQKEFSLSFMTGFGTDGTREEKEQDFEQVRGDFESNPFVTAVLDHIERKSALGDELISRLSHLA